MEATPRPWAFDAKSEEIWSVGKGLVATVKQRGPLVKVASDYRLLETEANGEFIVKAANAHDRLVEALEGLVTLLDYALIDDRKGTRLVHSRLKTATGSLIAIDLSEARAALALARGEVEA